MNLEEKTAKIIDPDKEVVPQARVTCQLREDKVRLPRGDGAPDGSDGAPEGSDGAPKVEVVLPKVAMVLPKVVGFWRSDGA